MYLFWPTMSNRHQCSPIKVGEEKRYRISHSQNHASYDRLEYIVEVAECPVCNQRYDYNEKFSKVIERIPYSKRKE